MGLIPGSPPRVWGQCNKTTDALQKHAVHPHGCGDNEVAISDLDTNKRFTPTGVGTMMASIQARRASRFTPTGVGTMRCWFPSLARCTVHPHGCGDNLMKRSWSARTDGSPPRVWGQWERACAVLRFSAVHPHGCGDNEFLDSLLQFHHRFTPTGVGTMDPCWDIEDTEGGSPPRVWGQWIELRFSRRRQSVHPHGCGDNIPGSRASEINSRFTPTGVGTMPGHNPASVARHGSPPRVWGQCESLICTRMTSRGSPPRVWGQFTASPADAQETRFTPTGVGTIGLYP